MIRQFVRPLSGLERALQERLASIDRMRDRALDSNNLDLLDRADELERLARRQHGSTLAQQDRPEGSDFRNRRSGANSFDGATESDGRRFGQAISERARAAGRDFGQFTAEQARRLRRDFGQSNADKTRLLEPLPEIPTETTDPEPDGTLEPAPESDPVTQP